MGTKNHYAIEVPSTSRRPTTSTASGSGDTFDYEFTAYLATTLVGPDDTAVAKYFKTDPELITGKRGG